MEKKAPKTQQRRKNPSVGLTKKIKMETINKRDPTREPSVPSDLHSVTHTHNCQMPSHLVGVSYMKLILQLKSVRVSSIHTRVHTSHISQYNKH